ncbi:xylulokinase [Rappaport israeli]|uniref:xylulokinase n=1 Tax=Rappaport israeli TaxID=1839807 RepID=UPI000931D0C6|nr:xylulokinase [Rappaport israeli]
MYIGIDLGTSSVKVALLDEAQQLLATTSRALAIERPKPLWVQQNPSDWWQATEAAMDELAYLYDLSAVQAIGLSGQMHGATVLDRQDRVLFPAILWNDGRCEAQCVQLEKEVPESRQITGNLMMAGFTAPKLKWLAEHHRLIFKQVAKVLLPKDYLRLCLTGEYATDVSDASGTMWLEVGKRRWSDKMLSVCELEQSQMPKLFEGNEITGYLRDKWARQWKMKSVAVVAGGGDNAASAVGLGLYEAGQAMLSLGTSGVYFVVSDGFLTNTAQAVHSFCHALPERWHLMSVSLSAASAIDWAVKALGFTNVAQLFAAASQAREDSQVVFLPYLSGERTPHNNVYARGAFLGLGHEDNSATLARAVIEGVSFALLDGIEALEQTGVVAREVVLVGGGAKSAFWRQLLANICGKSLHYYRQSPVGAALGAARLAAMAVSGERVGCPLSVEVSEPKQMKEIDLDKRARFIERYGRLYG